MDVFKMLIPLVASLAITVLIMPFFILYFTTKKMGQVTREEGPSWHNQKTGTPTMGGIAFVIASVLVYVLMGLWQGYLNDTMGLLLFVLVFFALIGFLDDFLKLIRQQNEGLTSRQKFTAQISGAGIFAFLYLLSGRQPSVFVPLFGYVNNVWLFLPFVLIWLTGFSNAVNLTNGLDGLVAGTANIAFGLYAVVAYVQMQYDVMVLCLALVGGLCGFFTYNRKPARIFMGDVGSLALGATLAAVAILLHREWSLLLVGLVFVLETASVMLQVTSFKLRQKRIFKMSPLHHHFELSGWSEWKVVGVFWTVGLLAAVTYGIIFL